MAKIYVSSYTFSIFISLLLLKEFIEALPTDVSSDHTVCYGSLGCFSVEPPFAANMPLPMPPSKIQTQFVLFKQPNTTVGGPITLDRTSVQNSRFDPTRKTIILVHGFVVVANTGGIETWIPQMTETLLAKEDVNVIKVDWVGGASVAYDQAVSNTRLVGAQIAHLIRLFMDIYNYDTRDLHLIGFSLGAHVAGFAGKYIKNHNKKHLIGRITGLDPANPGFNNDSPVVRLDKGDAKFVDVIHTDTSTLLVVASGINRNIGHADYYPNGGASQPGCNRWKSDSTWVSAVTDMTVCDHLRAPNLFMNSINTTDDCDYQAFRCSSYDKFESGRCMRCDSKRSKKVSGSRCNQMGYWAKPPTTKKQVQYYLKTSDSEPFCAKHYQLQLNWRKGPGSSKKGFKANLFVTLHGEKGSTKEFALNGGASFVVVPGNTSRFLVSYDCKHNIGRVDRVSFRWHRPTCWTYFFCPTENVYMKRAKIIDASEQKRLSFYPLDMDRNRDGRKDVVEISSGAVQELFRKSFIRYRHPSQLVGRTQAPRRPLVVPILTEIDGLVESREANQSKTPGRLIHHITKHKREPGQRNSEPYEYLMESPSDALVEST